MKGWPAPVRLFAHQCLVALWGTPDTPTWLQWEWLCPKPKDPSAEVTLDGLRPLILFEVLRKLWVGIIINQITRAWERHHTLLDTQHTKKMGFGPGAALIRHYSNSLMPGNTRRKRALPSIPPAGTYEGF